MESKPDSNPLDALFARLRETLGAVGLQPGVRLTQMEQGILRDGSIPPDLALT